MAGKENNPSFKIAFSPKPLRYHSAANNTVSV